MRILIDSTFTDDQVESLRTLATAQGGHEVCRAADEKEAIAAAPEAEVLIGAIRPTVFAAASKLRWAQSQSAGMNNILFPQLIESEVAVSNAAGLYAPQGGEHAWSLLLALARGLHRSMRRQNSHEWKADPVMVMTGGTLGIIALGGFGQEMAKRARGYDMTILAIDPVRTNKPDGVAELQPFSTENLHSLLQRSDAVMVACPLTEETRHMIGGPELAIMKNTAYLVNVSRGGIIDETALFEALKNGQIAGAGLDVCEVEPLPADSLLWDAPNLIITPHRAGFSQFRPRDWFELARSNLERYLKGEQVLNVVDKRRGY